eukprot:gene8324-9890_t
MPLIHETDIDGVGTDEDADVLPEWAARGGREDDDSAYGVAADSEGNAFVTGNFYQARTFGDSVVGSYDVFVTKFNQAGTTRWEVHFGGDDHDYARAIAIDSHGDVYVTGFFYSSPATFGSSLVYRTDDSFDMFVVKVNSKDGKMNWTMPCGGSGHDFGHAIAVDKMDNIWVTGTSNSTLATFGGHQAVNHGLKDIILLKVSSKGTVGWAFLAGGEFDDEGHGVQTDSNYEIAFFTGSYASYNATFGTQVTAYMSSVVRLVDTGGSVYDSS